MVMRLTQKPLAIQAEKAKKEAEIQAYIDPELAEKAREEGNASFKVSVGYVRVWLSGKSSDGNRTTFRPRHSPMLSSITPRLSSDFRKFKKPAAILRIIPHPLILIAPTREVTTTELLRTQSSPRFLKPSKTRRRRLRLILSSSRLTSERAWY